MVMDQKSNEMGENPRKTSFRTLARVAQTMQQSPVEKRHSARFSPLCARHLRVYFIIQVSKGCEASTDVFFSPMEHFFWQALSIWYPALWGSGAKGPTTPITEEKRCFTFSSDYLLHPGRLENTFTFLGKTFNQC